jgi:lysozyme
MNESLRKLLIKHEGTKLFPYVDSVGKISIGTGRNLTDNGISKVEADLMLDNDIYEAVSQLKAVFPEYSQWTMTRQDALVDMMFNIGPHRFASFKKMIAAVRSNDWVRVAAEMRNSLWATQVPSRVAELAEMIEHG